VTRENLTIGKYYCAANIGNKAGARWTAGRALIAAGNALDKILRGNNITVDIGHANAASLKALCKILARWPGLFIQPVTMSEDISSLLRYDTLETVTGFFGGHN